MDLFVYNNPMKEVKEMLGETLMKLRKKHGYSQQEVADMLDVTRQTISNWEGEQAAPAIDKAKMLANLYQIKLDDLFNEKVEFAISKHKEPSRLLKSLIGKTCAIDSNMIDVFDNNDNMLIVDINDEWVKVEYERLKNNSFLKKEKVIKYIDLSAIKGFSIKEDS